MKQQRNMAILDEQRQRTVQTTRQAVRDWLAKVAALSRAQRVIVVKK